MTTATASANANASEATATTSGPTENPVPSITLSITQDDVKRVLEASKALTEQLREMQEQQETKPVESPVRATTTRKQTRSATAAAASASKQSDAKDEEDASGDPPLRTVSCDDDAKEEQRDTSAAPMNNRKRPLHDLVYEAAQACNNSMLQSFLERMKNSGSTQREIRAGVMVFHEMDLTSKIQHIFDVLEDENRTDTNDTESDDDESSRDRSLSRDGALSLFRAVIVAISSCIHKNARLQTQVEIEKDANPPPPKRRKLNTSEAIASTDADTKKDEAGSSNDSIPSLQTPTASFDSAVAPLKEEEEEAVVNNVRKEFQGIAVFARDRLVRYTQRKTGNKNLDTTVITFRIFQDWRKAEGARIAPWLDLLDLSRWKTPQRSTERNMSQQQARQKQQQSQQQAVKEETLPPEKPETEEESQPSKETASTPVKEEHAATEVEHVARVFELARERANGLLVVEHGLHQKRR